MNSVKAGDWLYVRNSKIVMHENKMRLVVDRWGLIEPVPAAQQPKDEQPLESNNLSATEYELVDVPQ